MPPQLDSLWFQWAPKRVNDRGRSLAEFNNFAVKLALACEKHLDFEQRHFHRLPEPEVEAEVRAIPSAPDNFNPDDLMPMLKDIRWRHIVAERSYGFERRRRESQEVPGHPDQSRVVEVSPEHPINQWIRARSDTVVLALIRENPKWLRNAAVADRICKWREDLLEGDAGAAELLLRQLMTPHKIEPGRRRPPGPRAVASAEVRRWALDRHEEEARSARAVWLELRAKNRGIGLEQLGRRMLGHEWPSKPSPFKGMAEPLLLLNLGEMLLIVKDRENKRDVVIDDDGWPRAKALALLAARWGGGPSMKGWILRGAAPGP